MDDSNIKELDMIKKRNHYIILVGVILILIASGLCLLRDWNRRVKEPVMLPVCMEVGVERISPDVKEENIQIELFYITDNKYENLVRGISFPERPDLNCYANENTDYSVFPYNTSSWKEYGRYRLHQIMVELEQVPLEEEIILTQAELIWNNNKHTIVDIGKVILYYNDYGQTSLETNYSSSSTDGTSVVGMEVLNDITIESIESPLLPYVDGKCTITINRTTYQVSELNNLDLEFKKDDYIEITINTQGIMNQEYNPYYLTDIQPRLIFKDKDGKQFYTRLYNMRESLEDKLTTENQIHQYLEERESRNE